MSEFDETGRSPPKLLFGSSFRVLIGAFLLPLFAVLWAGAAQAECRNEKAWPEARVILALYDSREEPEPRDTRLHRFLEFPLNHMGYVLEYWDLSIGLPDPVLRSDIAAIASWFQSPLQNIPAFENWAAGVTGHCAAPGWLVIGDPGTAKYGADMPERAAFLRRLGLASTGGEILIGSYAESVAPDETSIGYEAPFVIEPGNYRPLRARPDATSFLRIAPSPEALDQAIDIFVVGPEGVYLHGSAAVAYDRRTGDTFWIVDPFRLIGLVLGEGPRPVPDVTTLNGRRIFLSTVDSEGWLSVAPALTFGEDSRIAAEILRDRVIVPYGDLPQTVAVLSGDFEIARGERIANASRSVAEQLFALPQVLIASSGKSLVRDWQFFAGYNRDTETRQLDEFTAEADGDAVAGLVNIVVRNLEGAFANPGAGSDQVPNAPRKYTTAPFDLDAEIVGAIAEVEALAPAGRTASTFVWTGNARPFREALSMVRAAGYRAIGGGGGIYNAFAPSLSNLSPFYAAVGTEMQVYDGLSGDRAYTGFWTSPIHGFHLFSATLDATEAPRRLKPFHLVYSAQSMIDFGTRRAVEEALEAARSRQVIPITAAEYVDLVRGFRSFRAEPVSDNAWRILDRGALQTVRFDNAADLSLDLGASEGVLGARREGMALYVALLPSADAPLIVLTEGDAAMRSDGATYGLVESRLRILDLTRTDCGLSLSASGWGAGRMIWKAPPGGTYTMRVEDPAIDGAILQEVSIASDSDGMLDFVLPPLQGQSVDVSLIGGC